MITLVLVVAVFAVNVGRGQPAMESLLFTLAMAGVTVAYVGGSEAARHAFHRRRGPEMESSDSRHRSPALRHTAAPRRRRH